MFMIDVSNQNTEDSKTSKQYKVQKDSLRPASDFMTYYEPAHKST
jgi:hypothetical protein